MAVTPENFALDDYKLKISYLTAHFTRMWTRFNYFVAIETALVGGKFLIPNNVPSRALAAAGVVISVIWYVMGAEDRYLVRLYRFQVEKAARKLAPMIWSDETEQKAYRPVGDVGKAARAELQEWESHDYKGNEAPSIRQFLKFEWLSGWRWERISTTRLAALFPLLVLILWLIMLVTNWSPSVSP